MWRTTGAIRMTESEELRWKLDEQTEAIEELTEAIEEQNAILAAILNEYQNNAKMDREGLDAKHLTMKHTAGTVADMDFTLHEEMEE